MTIHIWNYRPRCVNTDAEQLYGWHQNWGFNNLSRSISVYTIDNVYKHPLTLRFHNTRLDGTSADGNPLWNILSEPKNSNKRQDHENDIRGINDSYIIKVNVASYIYYYTIWPHILMLTKGGSITLHLHSTSLILFLYFCCN